MKKENIKANVEKGPVTGRTLQEGDGYVFASKPRFLGRHIRHSSSGGGGGTWRIWAQKCSPSSPRKYLQCVCTVLCVRL